MWRPRRSVVSGNSAVEDVPAVSDQIPSRIGESDALGSGQVLAPSPELRRRRIWVIAVALIVLVAGIGGSVAAGLAWSHYQQAQAKRSFTNTASAVAGAVNSSLRRNLDFDASFASLANALPTLTNSQLNAWLQGIDVKGRYPGTEGFSIIERVTPSQLPFFVAGVEADPPINVPTAGYSVYPSGVRSQYCLIRLGIVFAATTGSDAIPPGLDFCAPIAGSSQGLFGSVFKQATDAGTAIVTPGVPRSLKLPKSDAKVIKVFRGLFNVVAPIYSTGKVPATVAERKSSITGWL